jgi:hypothetical protein
MNSGEGGTSLSAAKGVVRHAEVQSMKPRSCPRTRVAFLLGGLAIVLSPWWVSTGRCAQPSSAPNIIVILADDKY